jgi:hypothetical protein
MFLKPTIRPSQTRTIKREQQSAACPECSGLQCLCRPRFFAGQLLSEEDLNRLDRYILEKNRLHNRYLHGWGIVCGLEVVCHPCKDEVIVREGYALSPCGDDIIVCKDTTVPICELIRQCKEKERLDYDCEPYPSGIGINGCKDECQDWVLFIRYDEKPTRGVTALRAIRQDGCCSRCSGSSEACGCGCHASSGTNGQRTAERQTPAQCEPTVICEGYRFEVAKYQPQELSRLASEIGLGQKIGYKAGTSRYAGAATYVHGANCFDELVARLPSYPGNTNLEALRQWCCDVKETLKQFFHEHLTYDCQVDENLAAITCPPLPSDPNSPQQVAEFHEKLNTAIASMSAVASSYLNYCLCSPFSLPCPASADDLRVPLAVVSVCNDGCQVMKICNLHVRRIVFSLATLQDLLYRTGIMQSLQSRLTQLCCPDKPDVVRVGSFQPSATEKYRNLRYAARAFRKKTEFSSTVFHTWATSSERADAHSMLLGALGALDDAGKPLVSDEALRNPEQFLIANNLARPLLDLLIPEELANRLRPLGAEGFAKGAETPAEAEAAGMRSELDELRKTVAEQQARIDELRKRLG